MIEIMKAKKVDSTRPSGGMASGMPMKSQADAADHAGEDQDRHQHIGRAADREGFDRRPVDEQAGQRDQRADDGQQRREHARRGAGPEGEAVLAGQIARGPESR